MSLSRVFFTKVPEKLSVDQCLVSSVGLNVIHFKHWLSGLTKLGVTMLTWSSFFFFTSPPPSLSSTPPPFSVLIEL